MKRIKEIYIEIPKTDLRCSFCYCSMKNELVYNLDDNYFYHYECLFEKFRANDITEFQLFRKDNTQEVIPVTPETKKY